LEIFEELRDLAILSGVALVIGAVIGVIVATNNMVRRTRAEILRARAELEAEQNKPQLPRR
jgi:uncharacterized membrane-anchored protein YhcB (DUF1043 family)